MPGGTTVVLDGAASSDFKQYPGYLPDKMYLEYRGGTSTHFR